MSIIIESKATWILLICFLTFSHHSQSQESKHLFDNESNYDTSYFINPVGHKMVLSGSFGELRSNHFHSGIDIKPIKYNTSEPIMAAADGYISRVKIQREGYGRAIYIDHPNGYTTVYAHLLYFSDSLESYLETMQYRLESFEVDIYLQPNEFVVLQGDEIGIMGSTGRSFGKHLHFEIRETVSEIPVNPMLFGHGPEDHKFPMINSLAIHSLDPDMGVLKKDKYETYYKKKGKYTLKNKELKIAAWSVGIAIHSFDKMDGGNNTNGIYSMHMYVDDSLYYGFILDKVSFNETYLINGHIDYKHKINKNSTYQQCYQLPGNTMSIYNQKGDGRIKLYKDKKRNIRIEVQDIEGNLSTLLFSVIRDIDIKPISRPSYNFSVSYDKQDTLNFGNIKAIIPLHTMYRKHYINCDSDLLEFTIGNNTIPLRKSIKVAISGLPKDRVATKRCVLYKKGDRWVNYGGVWDGDILHASLRKFGIFKVAIDTIRPTIKIVKFPKILSRKQIVQLKVFDNFTTKGKAKSLDINVYIDGKWELFQYKVMTRIVEVKIPSRIDIGKHDFVLKAEDDRGNINVFTRSFIVK